jgi:hypothetical protein
MALITTDELLRGLSIASFGGAAGACTLAFPGSPLWLVPAGLAVGGCALTVPEVRVELRQALPALEAARPLLAAPGATWHWVKTGELPPALWKLPGVTPPDEQPGAARQQASTPPAAGAELFDALEGPPHRLIIGHTRGGKTTLIHHLATSWASRGERVLVGDPDAAPGMWPGCVVRGHGDDVESIAELLEITAAEVRGRRERRAQGVRRFPPLHLVIDEAHDVLPALPGAMELFEDVARRGGKLNVRMTVGVQDKQVKTLGLERKSALLRNFQTADVLKASDGRRVAVLTDAETGQKVKMVIPSLTDPESLIIAPATATTTNLRPAMAAEAGQRAVIVSERVSECRPEPAEDLLAALLASEVPAQHNAAEPAAVPVPSSPRNRNLTRSDVTIEAGTGGGLQVNVTQVAGGATPRAGRRPRGLDVRSRRLRALYRKAGAEGVPFKQVFAEHKGSKEIVFPAWQEGKARRQG